TSRRRSARVTSSRHFFSASGDSGIMPFPAGGSVGPLGGLVCMSCDGPWPAAFGTVTMDWSGASFVARGGGTRTTGERGLRATGTRLERFDGRDDHGGISGALSVDLTEDNE